MPEEIKDFDQQVAAITEAKGIGPKFKLGGETFQAVPFIATGTYAEFMNDTTEGDYLFYYKFLESIIATDEDKEKLRVVLYDSGAKIPMSILEEIVKWLGEEFSKDQPKP